MKTVEAGTRINLKNVLFATDFSPCSNAALPYAVSFARRAGAELHVVHVLPTGADLVFMPPEAWPQAVEEEKKWVEERSAELREQLRGVPYDVITLKGKVSTTLSSIIDENKIDFLVLGTHGRTGLRKLFQGSVAEEIFRRCPCAVLTIGPKVCPEVSEQIQFRHILYATDFSEDSLAALPYAISLAEEDQASLSLLNVVNQPEAGVLHPVEFKAKLIRRLQDLARAEDYPWCRLEYLVEFNPLFETTDKKILEAARKYNADLIVLGLHREHGSGAVVTHFPTTAQHVIAHAECPVLTVRG